MDRNKFRIRKDVETEVEHIGTRREILIEHGVMVGSEITISGDEFRIWTSKTKLGDRLAKDNGWRIKRYDGEREIYVPGNVDYSILKAFGAKVKRTMSEEALKAARDRGYNLQSLSKKQREQGTSRDFQAKGEG